jgi:Flp pilus assembly protein TadG
MTGSWRVLYKLYKTPRAVAALEVALLTPVLVALLAFTVDFSFYLYASLQLSNAVSAGALYAMNNGQMTLPNSSGCASTTPACLTVSQLRSNIGTLVTNAVSPNVASPTVYYNTSSSSATDTDGIYNSCYCPDSTQAAGTQTPVTCGIACSDGTQPGSFLVIQGSSTFAPIFLNYSWLPSTTLTRSACVRVQ